MNTLATDTAARREALELDSFIVEAPAGAGKTELLTQRYLRLLAAVDSPEEILALTFTNKAANEMRERIEESLALGRTSEIPSPPHKQLTQALARAALANAAQRGWVLEAEAGRLRVMTLDSLCTSIARQMPLLSRFGSQPALVEDASAHYAEAARRTLEQLEDPGPHGDVVASALRYFDNDGPRLADLLARMIARREQWGPLFAQADPAAQIAQGFRQVISAELAHLAQTLSPLWQATVMPLIRFAARHREPVPDALLQDWHTPLPTSADGLPLWRALSGYFLTSGNTPRNRLTKNEGFPAGNEFKAQKAAFNAIVQGITPGTIAALCRLRELPLLDAAADPENDAIVRRFVQLQTLAVAQLWLVFRERGEVDFVELGLRASAALGQADDEHPSELAQRLDYRIQHLLVDEFQDTSPGQVELLARLTAGWQAGDGRTLFLVGDPMQSIYRFRRADVGLFLRVAEHGIGGIPLRRLRLARNNRSTATVVDWINQHFPAVLPATDDMLIGEVRYRPFVATRDELPASGVFVHPLLCAEEVGADDTAMAEAMHVIALLRQTWQQDARREITILVRSRGHLQSLLRALHDCAGEGENWRFAAVDIEPLQQRQVVQDLIALTRALHHRADRLHWLAIVRAPWCGLTLADLHALAGDAPRATLWTLLNDENRLQRLSPDGQNRARHLIAVLARAFVTQGRQPRRRWVETTWRALGGEACLRDDSERADARAYFLRLDLHDAKGFALDALEGDMARLYATPDTGSSHRLQLMTMHKAKGLEFDTVIVPGLHHPPPNGDTPLLLWDQALTDAGEILLAAPVRRRGQKDRTVTSTYDYLQGLERRRNRNEAGRLLYVAATRAIRCLHLVGVVRVKTEENSNAPDEQDADAANTPVGTLKPPPSASLMKFLWPLFEQAAQQAPLFKPSNQPQHTPLAEFCAPLERLRQQPPTPPPLPAPAGLPAPGSVDFEQALAAAIGTLTHACLEQIAHEPAAWPANSLARREPALTRWLQLTGWSADTAQQGAQRVSELLAITLASADAQWVLQPRPGAVAELALSQLGAGNTALTRVMDRSFIENGERWIIDYKTSQIDVEKLSEHAQSFRPQLETYAALFAAENLPQRLAILYLAHGRLIVLP